MKTLKKLDLRQMTREELTNTRGGDGATRYTISITTTMPFADKENTVYNDSNQAIERYVAYTATPVRAADTVYIYVKP